MSSKSTDQTGTSLRRRLRVLERAQSLSNSKGSDLPKILPLEMKHSSGGDLSPASHTDDESDSDSSDDDKELSANDEEEEAVPELKGNSTTPSRPTLNTRNIRRPTHSKECSPMSPRSRAWYEFDLAVVVALVSPIGNWLTGGDHIKNLLLIALLIFYLHQIIEIPWNLYQKARPRHKAFHLATAADPSSPEGRYAALAASELQKWELFYLFLAFMSPFFGASLLRFVTAAVLGPDAISWFSAGLFVLATGVRPWSHVIDRLNERTDDLHEFVHYPSTSRCASEEQVAQLEERVAKLEKSLIKMRTKLLSVTEDVYDYVDDTMDAVELAMVKQERKWDKYEGKVKEVEQRVGKMRYGGTYYFFATTITACLRSILDYVFSALPVSRKYLYSGTKPIHPSRPSTSQLETIVEEDFTEADKYPILARPYSITSSLMYRVGSVAFLPLRAVARMVLGNY